MSGEANFQFLLATYSGVSGNLVVSIADNDWIIPGFIAMSFVNYRAPEKDT